MTTERKVSKQEVLLVAKLFFFCKGCAYHTFKQIMPLYLNSLWRVSTKDLESIGSFIIICFFLGPFITKMVCKFKIQKMYVLTTFVFYTLIVTMYFVFQGTLISRKPYSMPFIIATTLLYESMMGSAFSIIEMAVSEKIRAVTSEKDFKRTYSIQRAFLPISRVLCTQSYAFIARRVINKEVRYSITLVYTVVGSIILSALSLFCLDGQNELRNKSKKIEPENKKEEKQSKYLVLKNGSFLLYVLGIFICGVLGTVMGNRLSILLRQYFKFSDLVIVSITNMATGVEVICQFFCSNFIFNLSHTQKLMTLQAIFSLRFLILAASPNNPDFIRYLMPILEEGLRGITNSVSAITYYTMAIKYSNRENNAFLHSFLNAMRSYFSHMVGSVLGHITTTRMDREMVENRNSFYLFFGIGVGTLIGFSIIKLVMRARRKVKIDYKE
eukprot:GHVP01005012.1.p1 GENE.GHVP01005012.1~~GHVP01005012.1.p1  ORF type:complete len:441 (+),score=35.79 GHVP01005012.1:677-1999(+)